MTAMTFRLFDDAILDHPVLRGKDKTRDPYTKREAFMWMVFQARREPGTVPVDGGQIALKTGEFCHSFRFMADVWGWSLAKVQRFVNRLTRNGMTDTRTDTGRAVVSVCNFSKHQRQDRARKSKTDTVPPREPIRTRYENHQESRKKKKDVGETRGVGEEGGLGETSFPTPDEDQFPNAAFPFALKTQKDLFKHAAPDADPNQAPVAFIADPDPVVPDQDPDQVVPVPPEPASPELAQPAVVITAHFQPAPFTIPAPDVPPIPPDNVVHMAEHEAKRTRKAKPKAEPPARWDPDRKVPPDWIEAGHQARFESGLPWADLEAEARRFARHHADISGKSTTERGWKATWLNWVDKPLSRNNQGFQGVYNEQRHHASAQQQRPQKRDAAMGALAQLFEIYGEDTEDPGIWDGR
jgi:hypothetical protein